MATDEACNRDELIKPQAGIPASTRRWHIAKRIAYVVVLGLSILIYYLLWSLDQALDLLTP